MSYRNNNNYNQRRSSNDSGHFGGYRVYVGDIGQRIGRTDLEKEFGQYGPVTDVWMGKKHDQNTQDYAFIVYRYPEDADEAVRDRNGRKLCGRVVRVEHAKPIGSVSRRGRGDWRGGNRGYHSQRGNFSRRRSHSRERSGYKRGHPKWPIVINILLQC
uniref:RRM domain-containing protein n=1 Tax=Arion vulgaris TaxID=1028688 RepID=A0A0B7A9G8_9EUPU